MSNGYLLEINDIDAGLLIREGDAFAFLATANRFRPLDGQVFSSVSAAERAAWKIYRRRPATPAGTSPMH